MVTRNLGAVLGPHDHDLTVLPFFGSSSHFLTEKTSHSPPLAPNDKLKVKLELMTVQWLKTNHEISS